MIILFIVTIVMGILSFMFLLALKEFDFIPDTKVFNYFVVPIGCILSLGVIILGIIGMVELMLSGGC